MSQQAVADVFHVTQQTIFKYEHALAEPDLDVILHMADFFGTSVDYLIGNTDDPYSHQSERSKIAEALKEVQAYIGQKLATLNQQDLE